jgi:hypothetical protein
LASGASEGRDVRALGLLRLLLELRCDRVGVGPDLLEDVADDIVLEAAEKEVVALEVEAPPFQRRLRGPLKQLPGRVAEELRDVDALGTSRRRLGRRRAAGRAVEEVREELVEEASATPEPP